MDGTGEHMKLARFRKPKATCFLSFVEYRPSTNISNTMKNRSCYREVTGDRG
jgi:hypothetical protein